jgi:hypothetical protein
VLHHALPLGHVAHRGQDLLAAAHQHVGHLHAAIARCGHAEHDHPARGAVDEVDHVVETLGQQVDVFAVERGHKARVDALIDGVHDGVAIGLDLLDLHRDLRRVGRVLEHGAQQRGGFTDVDRLLAEQVEERLVFGEKLHGIVWAEFGWRHCDASRKNRANGAAAPRRVTNSRRFVTRAIHV